MEEPAITRDPQRGVRVEPTCRAASVANQSHAAWRQHAELAYTFSRQVRHEMANLGCALAMLETVDRLAQGPDAPPVPKELEPARIHRKIRDDAAVLNAMARDMVLLSQAANEAAYHPAALWPLTDLVHYAVAARIQNGQPRPEKLLSGDSAGHLTVMGDTLPAALGAFYFQWTPNLHTQDHAQHSDVQIQDDLITFHFPVDQPGDLSEFVMGLTSDADDWVRAASAADLSPVPTTGALWLARFIVLLHGGQVAVHTDAEPMVIAVTLPRIH